MDTLKTDILEILLVLAEGPRHGYGIVQRVRENTGGAVELAPSLLYRRLRSLSDAGLIAECGEYPGERGKPQRRYRLTGPGFSVLRTECLRLMTLTRTDRIRWAAFEASEDSFA